MMNYLIDSKCNYQVGFGESTQNERNLINIQPYHNGVMDTVRTGQDVHQDENNYACWLIYKFIALVYF